MKAKSALQSLRQGIVICDAKGCVVYVNAAYAEFTGICPDAGSMDRNWRKNNGYNAGSASESQCAQ